LPPSLTVLRPTKYVRVYSGKGAGERSLASALASLKDELDPSVEVCSMGSEEAVRGGWEASTLAIVFPGGADLPYKAALDGEGNARIAAFVRNGGAYIGLCAGAYYASAYVDFERGNDVLEVLGERELAFFPGRARGSVAPGFQYDGEGGAIATSVAYRSAKVVEEAGEEEGEEKGEDAFDAVGVAYLNGGPVFETRGGADAAELAGVEVLARYPPDLGRGGAAAVRVGVGRGAAVLCGCHPETNARWFEGAARAGDKDAKRLRHALAAGDPRRRALWRALLSAARLPLR